MPMIKILRMKLPYRIGARAARTRSMTRAIMFMGTGSDVGKSLVVAGLCRAFANRGLKVAPFKPQNMSNNAAVTADGGEIGRAQALQARAARRDPVTAMNPVLLKPEQETGAQVVLRGQRIGSMPAREYWKKRGELLPDVVAAFTELAASADLILVEGAGSASEINLRSGDIANFGFAQAVHLPVVLIGDINRGGVIASLVGTFAVADPADSALIVATLVNKFQGDPTLFAEGAAAIAARTGVPCLGPVPMFPAAAKLPAEDVLALDQPAASRQAGFTIVVPRLPRIANFDDLDPLSAEPGVDLIIAPPGKPLPPADLIILPGSKATISDLATLRQQGWDIDVLAHARQGRPVLGICGGYQMLGRTIADPLGLEGPPQTVPGLGLLDVETTLEPHKQLRLETASALGQPISGYHMHMGVTSGPDTQSPFASVGNMPEGANSGRIWGTYLHGLFAADGFRSAFLARLGAPISDLAYERSIETTLDALAAHFEAHLDLDALLALGRELG
jgi:adenosylcobyric acid synthase